MSKLTVLDWKVDVELYVLSLFCSLKDFELAYQLNKAIGTNFINRPTSFIWNFSGVTFEYSIYEWKQLETPSCYLVDNVSFKSSLNEDKGNLFSGVSLASKDLVKLPKKSRYLLISEDSKIINLIQTIKKNQHISYCYIVDFEKLKIIDKDILTSIAYNE